MSKYNSIAISGLCCTGKSTLCQLLSDYLNYEHVDIGQEFKKMIKKSGLRIEQFGSLPDETLRNMDTQIIKRMRSETDIVWDSRLSCYLARNYPNIFKIFVHADMETRINRYISRNNISRADAEHLILKRENEEKTVFKRLYSIDDPYQSEWVDFSLDTSRNDPQELMEIILSHYL
ncbi:MAG: cytidylate kinase family protein [Candidatus Bathyarchaeota archaeon]|nr:cytidylate kinase family protein [Candidatus Bathyarchaeota archaeon]